MTGSLRDEEYVASHFENLAEQNPARYTARWAWAVHRVGSAFREQGDDDEWLAHWELAANTLRARVDAGVASNHRRHSAFHRGPHHQPPRLGHRRQLTLPSLRHPREHHQIPGFGSTSSTTSDTRPAARASSASTSRSAKSSSTQSCNV